MKSIEPTIMKTELGYLSTDQNLRVETDHKTPDTKLKSPPSTPGIQDLSLMSK